MDIKSKLLELDLVEDNEYLDKYVELINNSTVTKQKYKTHTHHIIPRFYYTDNNLDVDNSTNNIVELYVKDHLLAHYYLFKCGKGTFKSKNISCLSFFFDKVYLFTEEDFIYACDDYQTIYEEFIREQAKVCSERFSGTKQSFEVIQNRVNKNKGKKRSDETKAKMSAWQKGKPKSEKAKQNMKTAQRKYFDNETEEHKASRISKYKKTCSQRTAEQKALIGLKHSIATKGRVVSEQERKNRSIALTGKQKTPEHIINNARSHSKYIYVINDIEFLSRKEAVDFILSTTNSFNKNKIVNCLQNKKYDIVDNISIFSLKYLIKAE